ncbi:MAG: cell division protein ZapA [Terriglobales bacterium]
MNSSTQVEIYDQLYRLSGPDEAHLQRLATRVDGAMRALARQTRVVDSLRLAVLAAVNLADENEMLRDKCRRLEEAVAERSGRYHELLDGALAS